MQRICLYLFGWLLFCGACTRDSGWEGHLTDKPGLGKVRFQMAVNGVSSFENYIRSLAIYAFVQTDESDFVYYKKVADLTSEDIRALESRESGVPNASDSKILKLTLPEGIYRFYYLANDLSGEFVEPAVGATVESGYLPYPTGGIQRAYFMSNVQVKPGSGTDVYLLVLLDRVVCRLSVLLDDLPADVDTVRYRISGLASRLSLDEEGVGDTLSIAGIYTRGRKGALATDTVIDRLLLYPALKSRAELKLTFTSGQMVVREKQIPVSGLVRNNDVYVTGRWDADLTTPARIFSTPFCSRSRSGD